MNLDEEFYLIKKKQDQMLALLEDLRNGAVDNEDKLYDLTDLVDLLKISRRTLFKHLSSGVLEHSKIGKKIYVNKEQFQKFMSHNNQNNGRR